MARFYFESGIHEARVDSSRRERRSACSSARSGHFCDNAASAPRHRKVANQRRVRPEEQRPLEMQKIFIVGLAVSPNGAFRLKLGYLMW